MKMRSAEKWYVRVETSSSSSRKKTIDDQKKNRTNTQTIKLIWPNELLWSMEMSDIYRYAVRGWLTVEIVSLVSSAFFPQLFGLLTRMFIVRSDFPMWESIFNCKSKWKSSWNELSMFCLLASLWLLQQSIECDKTTSEWIFAKLKLLGDCQIDLINAV